MIASFLKFVWTRLPAWRAIFYRPRRKVYLFLPINGAGLGHLTRSLAVAKRLRSYQPNAEIIFLTTSIGVTLVHKAGFTCHHITPAALLDKTVVEWNMLFYQSLQNVLNLHKPHCLVFDGTLPYLGLQKVIHTYTRLKYVWIKRGLYKTPVDPNRLKTFIDEFDVIISPGEIGVDAEATPDDKVHQVPPISLLNKTDLLEKHEAKKLMRLDEARPCAYLQLGAGNINGIADIQDRVLDVLKRKGFQVVLAQSPIALKPKADTRADSVIVDYPNSKYYRAFDFAVLAGGYNSVCEAVMLGLPAIFLPNPETGADDQLKRVRQAVAYGNYDVIVEYSDDVFERAIDKLLSEKTKASDSFDNNGAVTAAELIAQL